MANFPCRILIVDDHPIVVEGYRHLIGRQRDLEVCGVASTALEAIRKANLTRPHLAIIDLLLKGGSGLDLIRDFRERFPGIKLLVASAGDENVFAERVLRAGAGGFVSKEEPTDRLIEAIREVLHDRIYLSREMTDRVLHHASTMRYDAAHSLVEQLADRELEAFELMGRGLTTREIASRMHISPKTVDRYRENIKEKLDLPNVSELHRQATIWVQESH